MTGQNTSPDYQKVKDVFMAALEILPEKRAAFLVKNCADSDLRAEVDSLLAARAEAGEFLNDISAADAIHKFVNNSAQLIGRKIDNYRIEKEIGRGGMGIVLLAVREDFHQQAAIKLIKRGMDSDAILERFTREREILATLSHPFIARLTDGGTTDDNLPFFVMEYVEGVPIDQYCQNNNLSEAEIVSLFRKICEAVTFAHQKLVVHRDLKPSNILVTGDGMPKLLDFGIAKLLNSTAGLQETETNMRVLTPAYASPEQLRGAPVDTTSDVYSLGKILSELLSAETGESKTSRQHLNTDLQNILKMALHEESERRYGSVEKFSEDLRRYTAGLPVSARKDTFSYRTIRFIKRNRFAVAGTALFLLTLFGGLFTTLWQAREARRERELAERRFTNLRQISDSFATEIHNAIRDLPGSLPARRLLLRHAIEQLDALAVESSDNPELEDDLAQAYFNSAQLPDMLLAEKDSILKKEIAIYQQLIIHNPKNIHYKEQLALADMALADITKVRGSLLGALELYQTGTTLLEQIVYDEPNSIEHRINLSTAYLETARIHILNGDADRSREMTQKAVILTEMLQKTNAENAELERTIDQAQIQMGIEETLAGNNKSAITKLRRLLNVYKAENNRTPNDTRLNYYLWAINRRLSDALRNDDDITGAAGNLQTALSIIEKLLAASPNDFGYYRNTAVTNILYGQLLVLQKQSKAAIPHFHRALELSEQVLANDADNAESKTDTAEAESNLGNALVLTGKTKEGLEYLEKAAKTFAEVCQVDSGNQPLARDYAQTRDWINTLKPKNE